MSTLTAAPTQERRKFLRNDAPLRLAVNLLVPPLSADSVNISAGGLCLRLAEQLEVRSLVQLEIAQERACLPSPGDRQAPRAIQCAGRVSWVMQRLDLRDAPPFLFDVGIEFVNPPRLLRQWLAQPGRALPTLRKSAVSAKLRAPAFIRGRAFMPHVERAAGRPVRWHLVVTIDGTPCFSEHYPSKPAAEDGWAKFKRQQARAGKR